MDAAHPPKTHASNDPSPDPPEGPRSGRGFDAEIFRQLLEAAPDGMLVADASGRILLVNTQIEKLFGYPRRELIGKAVELLLPEDLRERHVAHRRKYVDIPRTRAMGEGFDLVGRKHDGTVFPIEISLSPLRMPEGILVIAAVRDVARRRLTEQSLRRESANVRMLQAAAVAANESADVEEAAGRILQAVLEKTTWAAGHLLLVGPESEAQSILDTSIWIPEARKDEPLGEATRRTCFPPKAGLVGRVLETGRPICATGLLEELLAPRCEAAIEQGMKTWVGLPIMAGGRARGILEFFLREADPPDEETLTLLSLVTAQLGRGFERSEAARLAARYARQLEQSNRELQDFATVASHDLQEPLRKIAAFSEFLHEEALDRLEPPQREYLEGIRSATQRMTILIESLLQLSRVTARTRPLVPTDLKRIVADVVMDLEQRIRVTRGSIDVGDLPTVPADPFQMRQLFQNLIGNALKFHRKGEPPSVRIGSRRNPDGSWAIEVSDNGIGFDTKYVDRIFMPFQRLHSRTEYEGTGMGLAICRKIANRHGGDIAARSRPGEGATFEVTLGEARPLQEGGRESWEISRGAASS